jgi:N-acetylneuraminate lyase
MNQKVRNEMFQGVWPAMFTPVHDNGQLNSKELEKLIELQVRQEVDGFYLLGSTGQGFLFNEQERMRIAEESVSIINGRLPVMVHVGALNTEESVRLAKHAAKLGVDAISAVGPIYYNATVPMALEHYRKIATATDRPFFPYQIGNFKTTDEFISRLTEIPNIDGMKLTTVNLLEISSIYQKGRSDWSLFSGADELMCHAALCGTAGAIGTSYNLIGNTCKMIRQRFLEGEVEVGAAFMLSLQQIIEEILPGIWTFFRRAMILKHGVDIGKPKPPLLAPELPLSDEQVLEMVNQLESYKDRLLGVPAK